MSVVLFGKSDEAPIVSATPNTSASPLERGQCGDVLRSLGCVYRQLKCLGGSVGLVGEEAFDVAMVL